MIEFVGHLTGNAFKYYKKTMIKTFWLMRLAVKEEHAVHKFVP